MKIPRLKNYYYNTIRPKLMKDLRLSNILAVPKLLKIVLSTSSAKIVADPKIVKEVFEDIYLITGQKPIIVKARKSIASFKLRQGMIIGVKVTLRRNVMYEFLDRLINIALPRMKDFRGFSANSFDNNGNYSFGIREQIIFPEVASDRIDKIMGLCFNIETSTSSKTYSTSLLESFNFPFLN